MVYIFRATTTGTTNYKVFARSEEDAYEIASSMWDDGDFGELDDPSLKELEVIDAYTEAVERYYQEED